MSGKGRRWGFSLIELVVSMSAVSLIFAMVFFLFSYGMNGYKLLDARQGAQGDALKARVQLERDFELTHFDSVGVVERSFDGHRRDIVCLLGLSDWNDSTRFGTNGLPLWDRYVVYYADDSKARGRLIRAELAPPIPAGKKSLSIAPLPAGQLATVSLDSPAPELGLVKRQAVVDSVLDFSCHPEATFQLVTATLTCRRESGRRPAGLQTTEQEFQAVFEFDPLNTSPRL